MSVVFEGIALNVNKRDRGEGGDRGKQVPKEAT
jgi:hypothetical protein